MTDQLKITHQQSDSKATGPIIATFVAMLIFGLLPILMRWSENEITPNAVIFNRFWIAAVFLGMWQEISLLHQRRLQEQPILKQSFDNKQILLLLAAALFYCTTQLLWAWSLSQTSVANSALLHSLTPFFTTIGGYLLFNQRFNYKFLIGLAIATLGTVVLGLHDLQVASVKLQGDLLAFLSAIFWAVYLLTIEKLRTQLTVTTLLNLIFKIGTLLLGPILFIAHNEWFPHSGMGWLSAIFLALTLIFTNSLLAYSLKYLSSSLVAMILLLDPVVAGFFAWIIFAETLGRLNLVAFAIIMLGIYLAITNERTTEDKVI